jgi:RHS repeat-associated protein
VVTSFLYDGTDLVGEYNSAGTLLRRYVPGPGVDEPLAWFEGSAASTAAATARYFHADALGSIVAVSDASGAAHSTYSYGPYGEASRLSGSRFKYTGQITLPGVGLNYYKARMYAPLLGRFLQTDPIGTAGGMNIYGYVQGDPVNHVDPTGHGCGTRLPGRDSGQCFGIIGRPNGKERPASGGGEGGGTPGAPGDDIVITPPANTTAYANFILDGPSGLGSPITILGKKAPPAIDWSLYPALTTAFNSALPPQNIDQIVINASRARRLIGIEINFRLRYPLEQLWSVSSLGEINYVPVKAVPLKDSCGNTLGGLALISPLPKDIRALIHTHPFWANSWPESGDYTSAERYDVYGITPNSTWVLRQGAGRGSRPVTLSGSPPSVPSKGAGSKCRLL